MTNADRECNSPDAIRRHADHPISLPKGSESVRNNAETGFRCPLGPMLGTQGPTTQRKCGGRFELFSSEPPNVSRQFAHGQSQSKVRWLAWTGHRRSRQVPPPKGACRLNFTAKPPSSG